MIEIHGGKVPNSNMKIYQICSNRGGKFWGTEVLEVIGSIINGVICFDKPHSTKELEQTKMLWNVMSITEKLF